MDLLVGSFTSKARDGRGAGLTLLRVDANGRAQTRAQLTMENPSYLTRHPRLAHLIYVGHSDAGHVSAVAVDATAGTLALSATQSSGGANVAHLACAPDGRTLVAANFGSGSLTRFSLDSDGAPGPATQVLALPGEAGTHPAQSGSQPHQVSFAPDGRHLLVPDRGCDCIWVLRDDGSRLEIVGATATRPGAGPRHLAWHPGRPLAYGVDELDPAITVYAWNGATASLAPLTRIPMLATASRVPTIAAAIRVSADARFVFASLRGNDAVVGLALIDKGRDLQRLTQRFEATGALPRDIAFDARGRLWIAAHGADRLLACTVDIETGELQERLRISIPSPACVLPLAAMPTFSIEDAPLPSAAFDLTPATAFPRSPTQ